MSMKTISCLSVANETHCKLDSDDDITPIRYCVCGTRSFDRCDLMFSAFINMLIVMGMIVLKFAKFYFIYIATNKLKDCQQILVILFMLDMIIDTAIKIRSLKCYSKFMGIPTQKSC